MADETFSTYMQRERDRLHAEREAIFTEQRQLETKLNEINREFAAVDAYEAAKSGKSPARAASPTGRRRQARRGSRRDALMQLIKSAAGLSRGEILEKMGLKGDKSGEMSVSNALTALTKALHVRREGGKYHAA